MTSLRSAARIVVDSGFWRPSSGRVLWSNRAPRDPAPTTDPLERMWAAAGWLERAQDAAADGGVSWGYHLRHGWRPSYPETTGYAIPTFVALAGSSGDDRYRVRAARCVEMLVRLQAPDGAFPAGISGDGYRPSIFNTGQIVHGLLEWHRATGEPAALAAARRGADWLVDAQDPDGAWRRFGYQGYPVTYTAHASCWVADVGTFTGDDRYLASAALHLDWVLGLRDPESGWFERAGFSDADHLAHRAVTHTLAYTLWGVLHAGLALDRTDAVAAARSSAIRVASTVVRRGRLDGVLDRDWQGRASYACLTGNAQMALVWMRLADLEPDELLDRAASRCLELVAGAQSLEAGHPGVRGGIPGSDPIWGDYIRHAYPNWAAKFYIDAVLASTRRRAAEPVPRPGPDPA